jgi:DHA1 family multidrug resistance protein-like MFS transporter
MLGVGIGNPVVPLFAATFPISYTIVGFAVGIFGLARIGFELPAGVWADRFGRRPMLNLGLILFTISGFIAFVASNIVLLTIARFIQGIGMGLYITPSLALLGDIAPQEKVAKYFTTYFVYDYMGSAIGPALGGFVSQYAGFRFAFLLLAAVSGGALLLTYSLLVETRVRGQVVKQEISQLFRATRDWRLLFVACTAAASFFLSSGILNTSMPLLGKHQGLSVSEIGLILSVAAFVNAGAIFAGSGLINRLGGPRVLLISFASTALVLALFPQAFGFAALALMAALFSVTMSLVPSTQSALATDIANPKHRAFSFSLYRSFGDGSLLLGPVFVGFLSDLYGFSAPFYAAALICLMTLVPVWGLKVVKPRPSSY